MKHKELNLGEQLVEVLTKYIMSGKLDGDIEELPFDNLGSLVKYKYQYKYEGSIFDGIIATYEKSFADQDYYVKHDVLQYYSISYDVAKELFYAMDAAHKRNVAKEVAANEKKIVEYLTARNNAAIGSCNGTSAWIKPTLTMNTNGTLTVHCHKSE